MLALRVERVAGDHGSGQVGDVVQQRLEAPGLPGLLADVELSQDEPGGVLHRSKQVVLAQLSRSSHRQASSAPVPASSATQEIIPQHSRLAPPDGAGRRNSSEAYVRGQGTVRSPSFSSRDHEKTAARRLRRRPESL
ncbi:hypothetical protein STRTUCAR8_08270 [Streptomyces turgidiscabies Car8]|uniref:Uncharacterized protein n=1 Tax=Streptomyces turgidiscabies (strain Car8) TaxID=698760 RepID=L7F051_STRT8|nr:hypothetical protein STRTUCAR8_08270 [Streptomyces turgidiscabies Car8]